jgi:hypothetical protein
MTITQTNVLTDLHNLMGHRTLPGGVDDDLKRYCQYAFDFAWRYYPWSFALKRATVTMTSPYLPTDFDLDGFRQAVPVSIGQEWTEVPLDEYDTFSTGQRVYALQWDSTEGKYEILTSYSATTMTFIYQITPPTLNDDTPVPFPSSMTVAIGAAVYSKQGENPTRADISQEWDEFRDELDKHTAHAERSKPRRTRRNLQDVMGTHTGAV